MTTKNGKKKAVINADKLATPTLPLSTAEEPPKIESTPIKAWKKKDGTLRMVSDSERHKGLKEVMGVKDSEIAEHILKSGIHALDTYGRDQVEGANLVMQSTSDQAPKDSIEARLITQATALYANGMDCLSRANKSDSMERAVVCTNLGVKLIRLHNETIEALSRYRRGGEQKVVVQHVNVNDGGKAIVGGNLEMGGGGGG